MEDSKMTETEAQQPGKTASGSNEGTTTGNTIWCVECEDVAASVKCAQCDDYFCGLCFQWQHQHGNRANHKRVQLPGMEMFREVAEGTTQHFMQLQKEAQKQSGGPDSGADAGSNSMRTTMSGGEKGKMEGVSSSRVGEMAKYIPMRVSGEERTMLKLLEGALEVSEYTDNVDVVRGWTWRNSKQETIQALPTSVSGERLEAAIDTLPAWNELVDFFQLLLGLMVAGNYKEGSSLVASNDVTEKSEFLSRVLEIGRRFKITNPEKMRCSYGKMMHLMQDAPAVVDFSVKSDIVTVHSFLDQRGGLAVLGDGEIDVATASIPVDPSLSRADIDQMAKQKRDAVEAVCKRHLSSSLSEEEIRYALNSIGDLNSYVDMNRRPVDAMIALLEQNFSRNTPEQGYSLEIMSGMRGSKLSHSHSTHFTFVLQSLHLWRKVVQEMFRLWILAEKDLLNESNGYRLMNTGQGMNRVQSAPKIAHAMHSILSRVQAEEGSWVGLSVVHLGDRDVPNALVFIDKYTQVSRLLDPIVKVIEALPQLAADPITSPIINRQFGGEKHVRKMILADFFKHGFDGSGSDGGSCIDGRLTSAWNWCSKLEKKEYYPIFLLAGFQGFDGDFRK